MMFKKVFQMAAMAAISTIALVGQPASAQSDSAATAFAEQAIEKMQAAMPGGSFEMEPGEPLQINVANTPQFDEGTINLHRVYDFCLTAADQECQDELSRLVAAFSRETPPQDATDLRIIVRDAEYWGYVVETLGPDVLPPHRQIGEDLFAILALDSPQTISIPTSEMVSGFGLKQEEAWDLAAQQTRAILAPLPEGAAYADQAQAFEGEEYISSLLFDVEAWAQIAAEAGPDLMITVTSDHFVFSAIMPDGRGLEEFKQFVVQDCAAAARCISPYVYRFRDGGWVIAD